MLALLLVSACMRPTRITQPTQRDVLYSSLVGQWQGTVLVTDSADRTRRVELPATLRVVPAPDYDGLAVQFSAATSRPALPGMAVPHAGHWHFDRMLEAAQWGSALDHAEQPYTVVVRTGGQNGTPLRLVLEGDAPRGTRSARIRQTLEVTTGGLRLVEAERDELTGEYLLRHAYTLRRAE